MSGLLNHRAKIFGDSNTVLFSKDKRLMPKEKMHFAVSRSTDTTTSDTTVLDNSTCRYGRFLNLCYGFIGLINDAIPLQSDRQPQSHT